MSQCQVLIVVFRVSFAFSDTQCRLCFSKNRRIFFFFNDKVFQSICSSVVCAEVVFFFSFLSQSRSVLRSIFTDRTFSQLRKLKNGMWLANKLERYLGVFCLILCILKPFALFLLQLQIPRTLVILWTMFQAQCQCKLSLPCVNTELCYHNSPYGTNLCTPPEWIELKQKSIFLGGGYLRKQVGMKWECILSGDCFMDWGVLANCEQLGWAVSDFHWACL